jgi:hypothetical protein
MFIEKLLHFRGVPGQTIFISVVPVQIMCPSGHFSPYAVAISFAITVILFTGHMFIGVMDVMASRDVKWDQ